MLNWLIPDAAKTLESVWMRAGEYRMHARVSRFPDPAKPPVVLVHGLGVSSRYLVPTAVRLADDYRMFVPDLPGFGRSERPRHILDVSGLADALESWMDAAGLPNAALLGNSLGCQVIVDLAVRRPERVERAVLVGPTMDAHARSATVQVGRLILDSIREPPTTTLLVFFDHLTCGPVRLLRTFGAGLRDRVEDKLPRMRCPTLVVRGTHDPIAPRPWVEEVARRLPHGRLIELVGAPHAANCSTPLELVRVVRPFLEAQLSHLLAASV